MGSSGKSQTIGYRYYAGLHLVFCHSIDKLLGIKQGEKWALECDITSNQTVLINKPELFGGTKREGGFFGNVDICFGAGSQTKNTYLQSILGSDIPAYRGLFALVANKCMLSANNPYIKGISALAQRTTCGWRDDLSEVVASDGHVDMNAAHIIYEALTNTTWGSLGYPVSDLDMDSFLSAATLLKAEGLGLSLLWAKNTSIEDFINLILDHIDGVLFFSHVTGLLTLKLIRKDYSVGGLPVVNESNVIEMIEFKLPTAGESINQVTVNYVDRSNAPAAVTIQDLGGISRTGQINAATLNRVGITTSDIASKVAARELQQLCIPVSSCTLEVNRKHWSLEPGSVFNFTWIPLGIENMAMRVVSVEIGIHTDSRLRIVAVRDTYGLGAVAIIAPADSLWVSPISNPSEALRKKIQEITWWQFVQEYGDADYVLAELDDTSTAVIVFCARPSSDSIDYELWSKNQGAVTFVLRDTDTFPFTGTLSAAVSPAISSVLQLQEGVIDLDLVHVGDYAALENELVAITAIDTVNRTITVDRGVLDTIPVAHAAGAYVWCHDGFYGLDATQRAVGEVVETKILPSTSLGRLGIDAAAVNTITCVGRMMRPYPPGNVQINGQRWPSTIGLLDELSVSWAHRDRRAQTVSLNRQDEGNIGPETGVTYTLRIYGQTGSLIHTETGLTSTSYTYPAATEKTDSGLPDLNTSLRIELESVRSSVISLNKWDLSVTRA